MNRKISLLLVVSMGLIISACAPKATDTVKPQEPTTSGDTSSSNNGEESNAYNSGYSRSDLINKYDIQGDPRDEKVVFFEYNSTVIDTRSNIILTAHANYLEQRGSTAVTLEGHADERGTRDFNLALGERRAQTAAEFLNSRGASNKTQIISYGEERPANSAHNESAWRENRRVEISY